MTQGLYLIEGVRLVEEALFSGVRPEIVAMSPDTLAATPRGRALYGRLSHDPDLPAPLEVTPAVLHHVSATETPSGVVAAVPLPAQTSLNQLPARRGLSLVLDGVQDPGNAGTILRTAWAADLDAVIALHGCVDLYAPKVVRSAMGAHFRVALATNVELDALRPWLAQRGQTLLADAHATSSIYETDLRPPTILIVGGEAGGALRAASIPDPRPVSIPMPGHSESLNVAMAASIIVFEALRQRGAVHSCC
ncbi:MAG TPA: RNA methyltransferase [Chloroflexota bacterium]|nr:RNA methyltransferase [Chloroflexota bacterium]